MRISDLLRMAARNLKGRWAAIPALGMAIGAFCLCVSGAVLTSVNEEKSLPYELNVASGATSLSDNILAGISAISDVTAATPVLQVPADIKAGDYSAQLTLTGINAAYLNKGFAKGGAFPDSSAMPYIVLNKAACKQFAKQKNNSEADSEITETETPQIDWLNAAVSIQTGVDSRPVVSKISGILAGDEEEQESAAYISLACAKQLLRQSGQGTEYAGARVRVTNIGCASSVSREISALGLNVANANEELQAKWDMETKETTYLIVIGAFCLLCSSVLMAALRRISLLEQKGAYEELRWIGMKEKTIAALFAAQSAMIALFGAAAGVLVSASLPSFLSSELQGASIYTLPVPPGIAALAAAVCMIAGSIPLLTGKKQRQSP